MGVENSNQQQFGVNEALGQLVALVPTMTRSERNKWRAKGSEAILAEVARLQAERVASVTPRVVDPVEEEKAAEEAEAKPKSRSKKSD